MQSEGINKMQKKTQNFLFCMTYPKKRSAFAAILFGSLLLPVISAQMTWDLSHREVQRQFSRNQDQDAQRAAERNRRENERPSDIVQLIGVLPGMKIGEAGAGAGYFTFFLSERVGESGVVYALSLIHI